MKVTPLRSPSRRSFLKAALAAGASPQFLPGRVWAAETKPGEKIAVGFIGMGKQSGHLLGAFMGQDDAVQAVAVCDVDTTRREHAKSRVEKFYQEKGRTEKCAAYKDFRELIARKDIDAVCIATPDHWHALITIEAAKAGKDIYCEKPLVHYGRGGGGRHQRHAIRTKRVLQMRVDAAFDRRNSAWPANSSATASLERSIAWNASSAVPGRPCDLPEEAAEPGLDWDMWLGPAPIATVPFDTLARAGCTITFPIWRLYREYRRRLR